MYSTAFTGERLSKKGEGKEVLKNSYKNTPTIRVGLLLLDKGDRTSPVPRYSAFSFHHLADTIRSKMINPIRFQKYPNDVTLFKIVKKSPHIFFFRCSRKSQLPFKVDISSFDLSCSASSEYNLILPYLRLRFHRKQNITCCFLESIISQRSFLCDFHNNPSETVRTINPIESSFATMRLRI